MSIDDLQQLRGLFRDEVLDLVDALERALAVLSRRSTPDEERRGAVTDVYRIVHSVKGAARAVDMTSIERFAHAAEAKLGAARSGALEAIPEVMRVGGAVLAALRESGPALEAGAEPEPAVTARALSRIHAESPPQASAEPPPASPEPESDRPPKTERAAEPSRGERGETVRVSAQKLDSVVSSAETVLGIATRLDARLSSDLLDATLRELHGDLARVRAELRLSPSTSAAAGLLDRSVNAAHTAALRARDARVRASADTASLRSAVEDLLDETRTLRLARLNALTPALERVTEDAARAVGNQVVTSVAFDDIEVDRRVVEGIRDPLLHLVRNAVDHGIEPPAERTRRKKPEAGQLRLSAVVRGRDVEISIADDGGGFDLVALRAAAVASGHEVAPDADLAELAFLPGVTTRARATELSGRGMGLDIVRKRISELHGRIELRSGPGGTTFVIVVPLDLSLLHVLLVRVRDLDVAIVTTSIERLLRLPTSQVATLDGRTYANIDGAMVPLADLAEILGVEKRPSPAHLGHETSQSCVLLAVGERRLAVRVDALLENRDIVAKPLGKRILRAPFVSSAAVLADGDVALVLDTAHLVHAARPSLQKDATAAERPKRVLVVDDSVTTRQLERAIFEAAGFEVTLATDGQHACEILAGSPNAFDVVVSDIEMPRLDGFGLVSRIRATPSTTRLPIVLVTALTRDEDRRRALELGANAYIVKSSFDQQHLVETVEGLL